MSDMLKCYLCGLILPDNHESDLCPECESNLDKATLDWIDRLIEAEPAEDGADRWYQMLVDGSLAG